MWKKKQEALKKIELFYIVGGRSLRGVVCY